MPVALANRLLPSDANPDWAGTRPGTGPREGPLSRDSGPVAEGADMRQIDAGPGEAWARRYHTRGGKAHQAQPSAVSRGSPEGRFVADSGKALGRHLADLRD